jgi:hypothetical protein
MRPFEAKRCRSHEPAALQRAWGDIRDIQVGPCLRGVLVLDDIVLLLCDVLEHPARVIGARC